jgi:hypothetical protein
LRLSTWLSRQKIIEEERIKNAILKAKKLNLPRQRDLLLLEMNKYVTAVECSSLAIASIVIDKDYLELGSFSVR